MAVPLGASIVCPVLIGRGPQIGVLDRLIGEAYGGRGHAALISGEAGIGKSRLVAEAARRFGARWIAAGGPSPLALQGRCFEPDRVLPYAPLIDLLRAWLATSAPQHIADVIAPIAADLIKLLPELAAHLPEIAPGPLLDPQQEQRRRSQALVQLFSRVAADQPLLLAVEDLHWCDATSLEVLFALARRATAQPIMLLLTYRDDERTPELDGFLAGLDRERAAIELPLARLNTGDVEAMLRAIFDLPRPVRAEFLDALYATTEGNPFFVEEVLKALVAGGEIFYTNGMWDRKPLGELHIPRSVKVAVQRRLGQLSEAARELLTFAAVAGRRFDFALLQALTGHEELALLRLIKQLIAAQLVVEEAEDSFVFRHALTRQAVEADLLARERRALHRAIAEAIERSYAGAPDRSAGAGPAPRLADLAEHYYAAGMWDQALTYARRAAEQAQALYAPRAAAEQLTRAVDAARRLGRELPDLWRARGQAHELLGEFDAARADYEQGLAAARALADGAAEWQGLLDLGFLWSGRDYTRSGDHLRDALGLARDMGDQPKIAHSLNRIGNWHANIEQPIEARACHQEALALFEAASDHRGLAATLDLLGTTSIMIGDVVAATGYYERAIVLLRELDDRQGLIWCLSNYLMSGASYVFDTAACPPIDLAACVRAADEALQLARQLGWRAGEASVLMYSGLGLGPRGQFTRAIGAARLCLEIATEIEHRQWALAAHWTLGALYLDLLWLSEARRHLELALEMAAAIGHRFSIRMASAFLAETCAAQGEITRARAVLDAAAEPGAAMQTLAERRIWWARAGLALAADAPEQALEIADRLIASAAGLEPGAIVPHLWHLRGQALAALDRREAAEVSLSAALSSASARGLTPLLWRIRVSQGQLSLSRRQRKQAELAFAAARELIVELSENLPDQALRAAFLSHATARLPRLAVPTPRRAAKQEFDGLTERERQVAARIALGQSNREIGDQLVVSERTVEKHVENILSKLAFGSRAQIAAWAVEKRLTAPQS
jgi:DNA-binding CsgD family transcriptional regulator